MIVEYQYKMDETQLPIFPTINVAENSFDQSANIIAQRRYTHIAALPYFSITLNMKQMLIYI